MAHPLLAAVALAAALSAPLAAQHGTAITGVVQRDLAGALTPVANVWVVLHRVARDSAAPVDSVRSDARGRYALNRSVGEDSALFFTSAMHGGVAYFTPPFRGIDGPAEPGVLTVFDTTSVGPPVKTRGRHVIVSLVDPEDRRAIVEVFELENTSPRTRVSTADAPTWSTQLPAGATEVHIEQGDVAAEAVNVRDGRVEVMAPIPPGLRTVVFSYWIHASEFPATLPVPDSTTLLEVLVEEPEGRAEGAGLVPHPAVNLQGRSFQRFESRDVAPGAMFAVITPPPASRSGNVTVIVTVGLLGVVLLLAVARAALGGGGVRARSSSADAARATAAETQRLAAAIADLDHAFDRRANPSPESRAEYQAKRAELQAELNRILAERDERL